LSTQNFEHKLNKGGLFINNYKKTENHPDYRGSINVEGIDFSISAWKNTRKGGDMYLSLSVSKIVPSHTAQPSIIDNLKQDVKPPIQINDDILDDEIPF